MRKCSISLSEKIKYLLIKFKFSNYSHIPYGWGRASSNENPDNCISGSDDCNIQSSQYEVISMKPKGQLVLIWKAKSN